MTRQKKFLNVLIFIVVIKTNCHYLEKFNFILSLRKFIKLKKKGKN